MCEFTSWNMVESTFEMIPPMEQDTEKELDPDLNWVIPSEVQAVETENTSDGAGEMQSEASAAPPLDASQPFIVNVLLEQDPIYGNLVPMESLLNIPPELVLVNQPTVSAPTTPASTEDAETTGSSSTTMRVALRDLQLGGTDHLVPGSYILPQYMLRPGFPVQTLRTLDAECDGQIYRLYILASGSCTTQSTPNIPPREEPLVKVLPQIVTMGASMDRNGDKENLQDDASSSSSAVSTAPIAEKPESSKLREYLELQISNITIPVLTARAKKTGTKHSRKASTAKK